MSIPGHLSACIPRVRQTSAITRTRYLVISSVTLGLYGSPDKDVTTGNLANWSGGEPQPGTTRLLPSYFPISAQNLAHEA